MLVPGRDRRARELTKFGRDMASTTVNVTPILVAGLQLPAGHHPARLASHAASNPARRRPGEPPTSDSPAGPPIEIRGLHKSFGRTRCSRAST